MAIVKNLFTYQFGLRGKAEEYNKISRFFRSKDEALEAVASGDFVPSTEKDEVTLIHGMGITVYNHELQDFVLHTELLSASNQASKYINLDGVNNYIVSDPTTEINALDFTKDWSIGFTFVGVFGGLPASNGHYFMTLFSRDGVHITLNAVEGSSNWGLYVTSNNSLYSADKRAQANTGIRPTDFTRILFTYNSTSKRLAYYLGEPATGVYLQKSNLLIGDPMISNQAIDGPLCIGKAWVGEGGSNWSGKNLNAGVNNLLVSNICFTGPHLVEYFQNGEAFTSMELYDDTVAYCKMGEDPYPDVTDEKGKLTGGKLVNGKESDFKEVPTEV